MKQEFIRKSGNCSRVIVFFGGWGMDARPFQTIDWKKELGFPKDCDILTIYDYKDLKFDDSVLENYTEIYLAAWSMGVWAAEQIHLPKLKQCVALSGTGIPVDDEYGISEQVFQKTLLELSESSLKKFNRRMCGTPKILSYFEAHLPNRSIEDLGAELEFIGATCKNASPFPKKWTMAIIGELDMIFHRKNVERYWLNRGVSIELKPMPHFPFSFYE